MISENEKIVILNKIYYIIDVIDKIIIADSFVLRNKTGTGHGEAKLYIGPRVLSDKYYNFFNNFEDLKGFILKKDLIDYMYKAKFEYKAQEQVYRTDISKFYDDNLYRISELKEMEYFEIKESKAGGSKRFYLENSNSDVYKIFRQICLPTITYISIIKLFDESSKNIFYYYRPFLDYFYDKKIIKNKIKEECCKMDSLVYKTKREKDVITKARIGQGKYRESILEEFPSGCLITNINDERLLIASHIKPWVVSNDKEKIDRYNGLLLSPTYDRLFDQGFITFSDDGIITTSPYISPLNWKKLNLKNGKKYDLKPNAKRAKYLEYHKNNIFKGIIN